MVTQAEKTLVTLEEVKEFLSITDDNSNTILGRLCVQISDFICKQANRKFLKAAYTEYFNGGTGINKVFLREYPVASITTVHDDPDRVYGDDALLDSDDYVVDGDTGILYFDTFVSKGLRNIKVVYEGGYDPIPNDIKLCACVLIAKEFKSSQTQMTTASAEQLSFVDSRIAEMKTFANEILNQLRTPQSG